MPRQPRLEIPGALYHVIARGNERRKIFLDKEDRADFLERLGEHLPGFKARCYAWVLMDNHFHLLVRTGKEGLSPIMRRLMTGYVGYFNRKYRRSGHLFQNRYKSILCQEETYLLELVRYIHLNPLRAKIVEDIRNLAKYPWSGHLTLLGKENRPWQQADEILGRFSKTRGPARAKYLAYLQDGAAHGKREELTGGGLRRSAGGRRIGNQDRQAHDSRILGNGDFVEEILKEAEATDKAAAKWRGIDLNGILPKIAEWKGLEKRALMEKGRTAAVSEGKAVLIYVGTEYLGKTGQDMGLLTKMSSAGASKARARGRAIFQRERLDKLIS